MFRKDVAVSQVPSHRRLRRFINQLASTKVVSCPAVTSRACTAPNPPTRHCPWQAERNGWGALSPFNFPSLPPVSLQTWARKGDLGTHGDPTTSSCTWEPRFPHAQDLQLLKTIRGISCLQCSCLDSEFLYPNDWCLNVYIYACILPSVPSLQVHPKHDHGWLSMGTSYEGKPIFHGKSPAICNETGGLWRRIYHYWSCQIISSGLLTPWTIVDLSLFTIILELVDVTIINHAINQCIKHDWPSSTIC